MSNKLSSSKAACARRSLRLAFFKAPLAPAAKATGVKHAAKSRRRQAAGASFRREPSCIASSPGSPPCCSPRPPLPRSSTGCRTGREGRPTTTRRARSAGPVYEHALQRYADQHRWARQRQQQAGVAGGAGVPPGTAASRDPSFRLNNAGGHTIREIYVSAATSSAWGPDRLGSAVLAPGQRVAIPLPMGQCVNDVRVVFMDGRADERRQVNTCALTDMAFR